MGDSLEARTLAQALAPKVHACTEPLRGENLAAALHGLQSFGDSPQVLAADHALVLNVYNW